MANGFVLGEHYTVQYADDLQNWHSIVPAEYEVISVISEGPGISRVVIKLNGAPSRRFHRMIQLP